MNHFPFGVSEDDHFSIIEKYFMERGPVFHQFESYEHMVNHTIQKIFDECTSIEIESKNSSYKATFGQVYFEKASIIDENHQIKYITPNEARLRDITYDSPIFVDIKEEFWEKGEKVNQLNHPKVFFLRLPTMVRSSRCNLYGKSNKECIIFGECENDPGGYFIVNGKERVLICQERLNYNQIYLFESNSEKFPYIAEIRSMSDETNHSVLLKATVDKDFKNCCFSLPYMSKEVLAGTVFKALGFDNDDIYRFIDPYSEEEQRYTKRLIRESMIYNTKEKAIKYISKSTIQKVEDNEERRIQYTIQVIENELFPHMGISTPLEKCILLGKMINKLFRVCLGKRKHEDRDNVSIKRIEGPGVLLSDLFRMCLKRYCDNLKKYLEKRQDIITAISRTNSITTAIKSPMCTGNWGVQKNTYIRTGVSQIMSRLTYPATISHLRRVVIPIGKEGKNVKIRQIHPTQCFFIDVIESPEGKGIGIIKNLALLAKITVGCNPILVRNMVEKCKLFMTNDKFLEFDRPTTIYINGTLIGITNDIDECYHELYKMKFEQNVFNDQVSISKDKEENEIRIFCDHGRFMRPLINVQKEDGVLMPAYKKENVSLSWFDLIENDIVRYIDSNEVENSLIAMFPSDLVEHPNQPYNYCEIHPSTMLGVCSSVIPYGEHNQCIFKDEPVYMSDGTTKRIKDINVGDHVITFNPDNQKQTIARVSHIYANQTTKKMYHVTTINGRRIQATYDHQFMTSEGWKPLEDIHEHSSLIGISMEQKSVSTHVEHQCIMDQHTFRSVCETYGISNRMINIYTKKLEECGLLPLYSTSYHTIILARLVGFCLTDAWIGINSSNSIRLSADFGHFSSVELFMYDISQLGFDRVTPRYSEKEGYGSTWNVTYIGALPLLFVSLGCMVGKKSTQSYPVLPTWITNGSDMVKREFLAGFQGGDGSKIKNEKYNQIVSTSKTVVKEHEESLILMMNQIITMFRHLGIDVSAPTKIDSKEQSVQSMTVSYNISNEQSNLILYFDTVGYRYNIHKISKSGLVVEYLRYIHTQNVEKEPSIDFNKWQDMVTIKESTIFMPILRKEVSLENEICDITIDSPNQSFLSGDHFCVHNCPRLVYESSMMKQALGIYALSFKNRFDTITHVMHYPQKPLIETKYNKILNYDEMLTGFNPIVAISCYTGFNQEDSVILNKASVDRGMFVTTAYRTIVYEEKKKTNCSFEKIEIPPIEVQNKMYNYSKLDKDGVVQKGLPIYKGDVVVGKTLTKIRKDEQEEKVECSLVISSGEEGIIDDIWKGLCEEGYLMIKIKIRQMRIPEVGDKMACFTDMTSVLTDNGWKNIKDIKITDKVATLKDDKIVYDHPINTFEYDYEGKMYNLVSQQLDMRVTPNHKLYIKKRSKNEFELARCDEMFGKRVSHKKNGEWDKEDQKLFTISDKVVDVKNWCYFLGIWYAEGWATGTNESGVIGIAANKPRVQEKLFSVLQQMDISYKYNPGTHRVNIYNKSLYKHLKPLSVGAGYKTLPLYVWNFSKEECRCLLQGMLLGDGSKTKQSMTWSYWTSSIKLAEDVQRLALHCGWSANMILLDSRKKGKELITKDGRIIKSNFDNYRVSIITTKNEPTVNHGHIHQQHTQIEEWIDYCGKVYCIEVPSHIMYVKQNGKPYWSGNSRSSQKGVCGLLLPQEDMPFTAEGITPDLLMNPHSLPSRMTLSQMIECMYSKVAALNGTFGDATAFTQQSINPVDTISEMLKSYGFHRYGNERLYNGFTGEMLDSEIFIGPTYYQRLKHLVADKVHCLTVDHDVLTKQGWKPITSITKEDKVATLKDGVLEYQHPINTMDYPDYEGSMYSIKNQSIDLKVTGNHRMWVSKSVSKKQLPYNFERADKLVGKMVRYKKDAEWVKEKYQFILPTITKYITKYVNIVMPEKIVSMNEWLTFFGIWYAEGWASGNETCGRVTISVNKQRVKDALFPSLKILGFEYTFDEKSQKVNICNNQLYMYMKPLSTGAPLKTLPEWTFELNKEQSRILIESMILGDGSMSKITGCKIYYTSSSSLANQFQHLCLHAGWACISSIHLHKGQQTYIGDRLIESKYDIIRLSVITTRLQPSVNHSQEPSVPSLQEEIFIENEKCHVVCIEVPNQIFYVRRNGKAVWTGNSRATGNVTMMHHQPSEGRSREGGLRIGEMERDALISHGGAAFIQETLFDMSDQYQVNVCEKCGNILSSNIACRVCKNGQVNRTNIPYCAKLLFQELEAMGIKVQINTK